MYVRGLYERYGTFEDQAKEKSGNQTYIKTKDNSGKKERKCFRDESSDEPDALDELPMGEFHRINHSLPVIDTLISAFSQRIAANSGLSWYIVFNLVGILSLVEKWKKELDNKGYAGAILMDLSKAFDRINRELLIAKLYAYGFSKDALKLINSYMSDRWQRIKVGKSFSS